ncbi:carboxymuconolactone decarboxylase family protein [Martelella endophytica]|uniref:Alkylhydroperoxidase n=1 Tax=Martelella endophytica TaxID=1486262 RepID=A0A0D5LR63_MAREN|nr:carboxymuconolactone decarboxylase family protein [Martelella endophytica]AJY45838.1 alkylhydroperoxidase [Martelella endophytica]
MSAIEPLTDEQITPHVAEIFARTKASMGMVPNLYRVLANAPAALDVYTGSGATLRKGVLPAATRELIAIAVAAANGCDYCLAAHTGAARAAGVSAEDRAAAQAGRSSDGHAQAVLELALAINATHGQDATPALEAARAYGVSDAEILETIAHVAVSILTNSVNNIVGTTLDFPKVERMAA